VVSESGVLEHLWLATFTAEAVVACAGGSTLVRGRREQRIRLGWGCVGEFLMTCDVMRDVVAEGLYDTSSTARDDQFFAHELIRFFRIV
jgi:hypothetical protein